MRRRLNFALLLASALSGLVSSAVFSQSSYPEVPGDVSYGSVSALPFRQADQVLAYGPDNFQYGRLWRATAAAPRANLIFIHGGCWLNEFAMPHSYALSTALSDAGYNLWSLEYRRTGDKGGGWPGTFQDVLAGVDHVQQLFDIDQDLPTILLGHSAGGHLALLTAGQRTELKGVIGLAAITNVESYANGDNSCETATPRFMGGRPEEVPERYRAANPVSADLHDNSILLYGDVDAIVRADQSILPGAATRTVQGAGHFDWVHPGTPAFQLLLETLRDML